MKKTKARKAISILLAVATILSTLACAAAYLPSFAADSNLPQAGEASIDAFKIILGSDADKDDDGVIRDANGSQISAAVYSSFGDGTASFDDNDDAGNDSGQHNGICRTFDTVTYYIHSKYLKHTDRVDYFSQAKVHYEFYLPLNSDKAAFDVAHIRTITGLQTDSLVESEVTEENPCYFYGIKFTSGQLISFDILHTEPAEQMLIPGQKGFLLKVKVNAAKNNDTFNVYGTANIVANENERIEAASAPVVISAKKCMNAVLINRMDTYDDILNAFNFNSSNTKDSSYWDSLNGITVPNDGLGVVLGRRYSWGVGLYVYNPTRNDMKGVEAPSGDIKVTLKPEAFIEDKTQTPTQQINVTNNYAPKLWYAIGSGDHRGATLPANYYSREKRNNVPTLPVNHTYTYYNGHGEKFYGTRTNKASCYDGGVWFGEQDENGNIILTVKNYQMDLASFPTARDEGGHKIFKDQLSITGTIDSNDKAAMCQITANKGFFSTCEFSTIQPYDNINNSTHHNAFPYDIGNEHEEITYTDQDSGRLINTLVTKMTILDVEIDDTDDNYVDVDYFKEDNTDTRELRLSLDGSLDQRPWFTVNNAVLSSDSIISINNEILTSNGTGDKGNDMASLNQRFSVEGRIALDGSSEPSNNIEILGTLLKINPEKISYESDGLAGYPLGFSADAYSAYNNCNSYIVTIPKSDIEGLTGDDLDNYLKMIDVNNPEYHLKYYQTPNVDNIPATEIIIGKFFLLYNINRNGPHATTINYGNNNTALAQKSMFFQVGFAVRATNNPNFLGTTASLTQNTYAIRTAMPLSDETNALLQTFNDQAEFGATLSFIDIQENVSQTQNCRRASILSKNYTKAQYENGTLVASHTYPKQGDTVYFTAETCRISKNLLQVSSAGNKLLTKTNYSNVKNEVVDYQLIPEITTSGLTDDTFLTTVTIRDVIPRYLTYIPGSSYTSTHKDKDGKYDAYIQADLIANDGTIINEEYLTEHPGTIVNGGEQGDILDAVSFEPTSVEEQEDGTTVLTWVYNVEVGTEIPPIYYSTRIGDNEITYNGPQLTNVVTINTSNDTRTPTMANQKQAEATITLATETSAGYAKFADKKNVAFNNQSYSQDAGNQINYQLRYTYSGADIEDFYFLDILPYNGDVGGSDFTGFYNISKIDINGISLAACNNSFTFYYLPKSAFDSNKDYKTFNLSDGWVKLNTRASDNGEVEIILPAQHSSNDIAAWATTGTLTANFKSHIALTPYPSDLTVENKYVNYGMTSNTEFTPSSKLVGATISGVTWNDLNKDGIQDEDEEKWSGVNVTLLKLKENGNPTDIDDYEEVMATMPDWTDNRFAPYLNEWINCETDAEREALANRIGFTSQPIVAQTGEIVDVLTGKIAVNASEQGKYKFVNASEGTYAVRFSDGSIAISKKTLTLQNEGTDDTIDSDAQRTYENGKIIDTFITDIEVDNLTNKSIVTSDHHDAGFYQSSTFKFTKISGHHKNSPLKDAGFRLYYCSKDVTDTNIVSDILNKKAFDSEDWILDENFLMQTSDEDGVISFENLTDGIYLLVEISAPEGYELSKGCWIIEVNSLNNEIITIHACDNDGKPNAFIQDTVDEETVFYLPNYQKALLPISGSIGIGTFMVIGIIFMGASIVYMCKPNRKKKNCILSK